MPAKPQGGDDDGFSTSPELSQIDQGEREIVVQAAVGDAMVGDHAKVVFSFNSTLEPEIREVFQWMVETGLITQEESDILEETLNAYRDVSKRSSDD